MIFFCRFWVEFWGNSSSFYLLLGKEEILNKVLAGSESEGASYFFPVVFVHRAVVLGEDARVHKVEPRTLGRQIEPTVGVGRPALEAGVPVVVRVLVVGMLVAEVSLAVGVAIRLEALGDVADLVVGPSDVCRQN